MQVLSGHAVVKMASNKMTMNLHGNDFRKAANIDSEYELKSIENDANLREDEDQVNHMESEFTNAELEPDDNYCEDINDDEAVRNTAIPPVQTTQIGKLLNNNILRACFH